MPFFLDWLNAIAPNIKINVISNLGLNDLSDALENRTIDLAIGYYHLEDNNLFNDELFDERLICLLNDDFSNTKGWISYKHFVNMKHIHVNSIDDKLNRIDEIMKKKDNKRKIAVDISTIAGAALITAKTGYVATIPSKAANSFYAFGNMKLFLPPVSLPGFKIFNYWGQKQNEDEAIQWLRKSIFKLSDRF
jgi:DNA-binding transcriptional LysR family regulator